MKYSLFILIILGHLFFLFGCKEEPVKVPTITSISPTTGRIDTEIIITGHNFDGHASANDVRINGFPVPIIGFAEDTIIVKAIPGVTTGKVTVRVANLAALSFDDFVVKPHTVLQVSPDNGESGDEITIAGANYPNSPESVKVLFYDSIPAEIFDYNVTVTKDTAYAAFKTLVPSAAATGKIRVQIVSETAESTADFTVPE